jgi:hypothetical protein
MKRNSVLYGHALLGEGVNIEYLYYNEKMELELKQQFNNLKARVQKAQECL